jgi:cytochrome P450
MLRAFGLMRRDPLAFLAQCSARYGPLVTFPIPRASVVFVDDASAVRQVLQTNHRNYGKRTIQYDALSLVTGEGLLTSDGDVWRAMRRRMQPAFHHDTLGGVVSGVESAADAIATEWRATGVQEVFDLDEAMMRTTLRVIGSTLFGTDLGEASARLVAAVLGALDVVVARAQLPVSPPGWLPTRGNIRLRSSLRALDDAVEQLVVRRRLRPLGHDVLGLLLQAQDAGDVTAQQVRNEVVTLIVAGHETVAATMTWTWLLLDQHPEVLAELRREVDTVLGPNRAHPVDLATVDALRFTRAVVDESLRLYPPAWVISRRALGPDILGDCELPAGAIVIMSPFLVHRDPALWERPEEFDPTRFLDGRRDDLARGSYLPFGAGPRLCIGRDLALLEATLLTALLARDFEVHPVDATRVRAHAGVTIRPAGGLPSQVRARVCP